MLHNVRHGRNVAREGRCPEGAAGRTGVGMKGFLGWWKRETGHTMEKRYLTLAKSLLLALLPLLCCLVYCGMHGKSLGEVWLPGSEWNDELFYYKQVEGIVKYGYPQGYFGFNESHALKLSFAAWSPVLVFPWILWGLVFGWNLMSPLLCNIALMMLCCFLFVWLVRPGWKQLGILSLLFCLYTPFVRYMLSVMPEVICFSMLILFYALAINYLQQEYEKKNRMGGRLALLFVLSGIMTLMRPYMVLFMLLPAWFWFRRAGWKGALGSAGAVGVTAVLYACIKHYLGAEYFAPLFFTDWAEAFLEEGIFEGIRYTAGKLYYMGMDFLDHTWRGIRDGLASGAFFGGFLVCTAVLVGQTVKDWMKKAARKGEGERSQAAEGGLERGFRLRGLRQIEAHMAFSFIAMLIALLLMYKLTEGSKHLLTFMAAAVFVIPLMETRYFKKAALVGVAFAYFYSYMALDPYDYQVPFVREEQQEEMEAWERILDRELVLFREEVPNYDNVVIWVFGDKVEGSMVNTRWQLLYALPEGFGISCCMPDYVEENFEELKGRFLCVVPGGAIEERCTRLGYTKVAESQGAVLYRR